jgi:hypothetical protein
MILKIRDIVVRLAYHPAATRLAVMAFALAALVQPMMPGGGGTGG